MLQGVPVGKSLPFAFACLFPILLTGIVSSAPPSGLTFGTIPFLLKSSLSYAEIAVFSLAGYPYSLKLLWSPIVDSIYAKRFGRRKSWIIPIQLTTGLLFWWIGERAESFVSGVRRGRRFTPMGVWRFNHFR